MVKCLKGLVPLSYIGLLLSSAEWSKAEITPLRDILSNLQTWAFMSFQEWSKAKPCSISGGMFS